MEKSRKFYWAIFEDKNVIFEGSFSDCWKELVSKYANWTLDDLRTDNIRIARQN